MPPDKPTAKPKKPGRFKFFRDIWAELHKVTWLSRQELLYLTGLVLLLAVTMGLVLGGIDYGLSELVRNFLSD